MQAINERVSTISCGDLSTRAVNQAVREALAAGSTTVELFQPGARHNLGVGLPEGLRLVIDGSAGYYVGGLSDGALIEVHGSAGWGAGESMRDGTLVIDGDAGNAAAASIRAGTVVVRGDASTRAGIAMKGDALVVGGGVGPMSGFMMQKGVLIICGDAAGGLADSMYAGTVYLAGKTEELGADAVEAEFGSYDHTIAYSLLDRWKIPAPARFRKLISGRKLWNFQKADRELWKTAL